MTVFELIAILQTMHKNKKVYHLWDGEPRTEIEVVYLSKNGDVITADIGENCYNKKNLPKEYSGSLKDFKTINP